MNTPVKCCSSVWHERYEELLQGKLRPFLRFSIKCLLVVLFLGWLCPPSLSFTPGRWSFAKKYNNTWLLVAMRDDLVLQLKGSLIKKQEVVEMLGSPKSEAPRATGDSIAFYGLGSSLPLTRGGILPVYWTVHIHYRDGIVDEAGIMRD